MRASLLASLDAREAAGRDKKKMYKSSVNFLSVKTAVLLQVHHQQLQLLS